MLLSFFLTSSCTKELTPKEYGEYVSNPENGLRKDQTIKDFDLSVMYEPVEYILGQDTDEKDLDSRREDLSKYEHFQFRLKLNAGGDILLYNETNEKNEVTRINHFGFEAHNDFMIISKGDTSYCKIAHYSRNYNLSPTVDLSLAFDEIEKDSDWQFIYTDQQFDLGRTKFLFKQEDLADLPVLK
jgi:hypothetical protein